MKWLLVAAIYFAFAFVVPQAAHGQAEYTKTPPSSRIKSKPRLIRFGEAPAEDVEVAIEFTGAKQVFGQIRYGTEDSTRVAIVLDQVAGDPDDFVLYVDADRDRKLTSAERVDGHGRTRVFELASEIKKVGPPQRLKRTVQFRRSLDPTTFSIATVGGYSSEARLGDVTREVWRLDGDGNGLFSDLKDEIWVDADADGKWDRILERFSFRSSLKLAGHRYAVRADRVGQQIEFAEIVGEGKLSIGLQLKDAAKVVGVRVSVYGDDGSAHSIESLDAVQLPIGRYMVGQISMKLQQKNELIWHFSFSHSGDPKTQKWYEVTKDQETKINPLSGLQFDFSAPVAVSAGEPFAIRPMLKTEHDLYITGSGRGKRNRWGAIDGNNASVSALDQLNQQIAADSSGFA